METRLPEVKEQRKAKEQLFMVFYNWKFDIRL